MSAVDPTPSPVQFKIPIPDGPIRATVCGCETFVISPTAGQGDAYAVLFAAAPDHALLLAAVCRGKAELEFHTAPPHGFVGVATGTTFHPLNLDPFGCPVLTDRLRAALREAVGGAA